MAGIGFGTNYDVRAGSGLGGNTYIVSMDTSGASTVDTIIAELTTGDANDNVFTIAGVEGTANGDHLAVQGTATPSATDVTVVATFAAD